jgi:hypothetical protein
MLFPRFTSSRHGRGGKQQTQGNPAAGPAIAARSRCAGPARPFLRSEHGRHIGPSLLVPPKVFDDGITRLLAGAETRRDPAADAYFFFAPPMKARKWPHSRRTSW